LRSSAFWQFLLAICLGRRAGKDKGAGKCAHFAKIGANKYRQDVRSKHAMQPALPKNRGIPATSRQSCGGFHGSLLGFNQGF
jgi:hypothetical protein